MTEIAFRKDFIRQFLPLEDDSNDVLLRLPDEAALSLYRLLMKMSRDDMTSRGLTDAECDMVRMIGESLR